MARAPVVRKVIVVWVAAGQVGNRHPEKWLGFGVGRAGEGVVVEWDWRHGWRVGVVEVFELLCCIVDGVCEGEGVLLSNIGAAKGQSHQ